MRALPLLFLLAAPSRAVEPLAPEKFTALKGYFESPAADPRTFAQILPAGAVLSPEQLKPLAQAAEKKIDVLIALTQNDATPRAVMREAVAALRTLDERVGPALDPAVAQKLSSGFFWARNRPYEAALAKAQETAKTLTYGATAVDREAPGSHALVTALDFDDERPVLGIFRPSSNEIVNAYAQGTGDVAWHLQALPQEMSDGRDAGGYTFMMRRDGAYHITGSGSLHSDITPAVERAILAHLGVRPAAETTPRWALRVLRARLDWLTRGLLPF